MRHLIEVVHSRYGVIKLEAERTSSEWNGSTYRYIQFYYPHGDLMGEWDDSCGGGLKWPTRELQKQNERIGFLDADERSYLELEDLLLIACHKKWPDFFDKENIFQDGEPTLHNVPAFGL